MPFTGSTGPVVHFHGLTGSRKPTVKADLATYVLGVPGQYESVALMLAIKWISIVVPIGTVFPNPVTFIHCGILHTQVTSSQSVM